MTPTCYIENCPIPFHDVLEAYEFLTSISLRYSMMFFGQRIQGRRIMFETHYPFTYIYFKL